ncbi:MAG: hypothetical protein PVI26_11830 [Chitinispirillia bacterium]|jgi:signal transduction histidine kinase
MRSYKININLYLHLAIIITAVIFPLAFYFLVEMNTIAMVFFITFSCLYTFSSAYSFFPGNLLKTVGFRLFLDNIYSFILLVTTLFVSTRVNPKFSAIIFYAFFNQCLMAFIINNVFFNSNRIISYYFYVSLFLFPLFTSFIFKISLLLIITVIATTILICFIHILISKLINELNQKNEAIIKLKEQEIKKNEKITDLTERLKRHEANNLLMRISTRLELMSVELIKAGRKCESEKLEVDIKRLSQMFENEIEIKLFTVIREIKYLMSKRFDDVEILLVNAIEHKNTKIKPILVQIIYILVENSYEAGAKTVRISTENESLIISDDGPGFDTNKIQYGYSTKNKSRSGIIGGYGLQTAIDYLELNNVGFDIRSRLNEGTTIKLSNFKNLGIV